MTTSGAILAGGGLLSKLLRLVRNVAVHPVHVQHDAIAGTRRNEFHASGGQVRQLGERNHRNGMAFGHLGILAQSVAGGGANKVLVVFNSANWTVCGK